MAEERMVVVRFSLRWLFVAMAFVAAGCASLIYASSAIHKSVAAATYGFLALCVLAALFGRRDRRPFWGGCAIIGLLFFAGSLLAGQLTTPMDLTEAALGALHPLLQHEVEDPGLHGHPWGAYQRDGVWYTLAPQWEIFRDTGQFIGVLILSLLGGVIATRLSKLRD